MAMFGGYSTPPIAGLPADPSALLRQIPTIPKPPTFFGQGGTGRNIAGFLGDALLRMGGGGPVFAPIMAQRQDQRRQDEEYRRRLEDQRATWLAQEEYKRANLAPTGFQSDLMAAGIDPRSPEGIALQNQRIQNSVNPFTAVDVTNPADGSVTRQYIRPGAQPQPMTTLPPGWTIEGQGGAGRSGPPTFR